MNTKPKTKSATTTLAQVLIHLLLASATLMLLGLTYFYVYLPSTTNHGETITVPSVEGKSISEVEAFLAKHDLRFEVNDSVYTDKYPPLTVIKQFPSAGAKVKENRKIYVSVNRLNPPTVPMPNLVDASVLGADAILKANELKRGQIELVPWPFPTVKEMKLRGRTLKPNDRVAKGSVIDLVVGDGGNKDVYVPDVLGFSFEDSKIPILGVNLTIGKITAVGDTVDGVIIKQKPDPGDIASVGDGVDLWIGKPGTEVLDE